MKDDNEEPAQQGVERGTLHTGHSSGNEPCSLSGFVASMRGVGGNRP